MNGRDGDSGSKVELTAVEEQLLAYIRAGVVDAEIAVRLGISNGDVKARVERLAAKMGVEGREGLRTRVAPDGDEASDELVPRPTVDAPRAGVPRLSLGFVAALIFGAGMAIGVWLSDESASPHDLAAGTASETATSPDFGFTLQVATPTPTQTRRIEMIEGREMAWAGRLFNVPFAGAPVADVSNREAVSAVTLTGDGYMALSSGLTEWRTRSGQYVLSGMVAGVNFDLFYQPGDDFTRFITGPSDSVSVYSFERGLPPVVVLYALGPGRQRHHLHVSGEGELYIELTPIPRTVALDESTGEALDTSSLVELGKLPIELSTWAHNICEPGPCVVSRQTGQNGDPAPIAGRVSCPDDDFALGLPKEGGFRVTEGQMLTLDAGEFRLHFSRQVSAVNGVQPGDLDCPGAREVSQGDPLVPAGPYLITASSPTGERLDVVVDGEGRLFVGTIDRHIGCPCVSGS